MKFLVALVLCACALSLPLQEEKPSEDLFKKVIDANPGENDISEQNEEPVADTNYHVTVEENPSLSYATAEEIRVDGDKTNEKKEEETPKDGAKSETKGTQETRNDEIAKEESESEDKTEIQENEYTRLRTPVDVEVKTEPEEEPGPVLTKNNDPSYSFQESVQLEDNEGLLSQYEEGLRDAIQHDIKEEINPKPESIEQDDIQAKETLFRIINFPELKQKVYGIDAIANENFQADKIDEASFNDPSHPEVSGHIIPEKGEPLNDYKKEDPIVILVPDEGIPLQESFSLQEDEPVDIYSFSDDIPIESSPLQGEANLNEDYPVLDEDYPVLRDDAIEESIRIQESPDIIDVLSNQQSDSGLEFNLPRDAPAGDTFNQDIYPVESYPVIQDELEAAPLSNEYPVQISPFQEEPIIDEANPNQELVLIEEIPVLIDEPFEESMLIKVENLPIQEEPLKENLKEIPLDQEIYHGEVIPMQGAEQVEVISVLKDNPIEDIPILEGQMPVEISLLQEDGPVEIIPVLKDIPIENLPNQEAEFLPEGDISESFPVQGDPFPVDSLAIPEKPVVVILMDTPQETSYIQDGPIQFDESAPIEEFIQDDLPFQVVPTIEEQHAEIPLMDEQIRENIPAYEEPYLNMQFQENPLDGDFLINSEDPTNTYEESMAERIPPVFPLLMDDKEFIHFNVKEVPLEIPFIGEPYFMHEQVEPFYGNIDDFPAQFPVVRAEPDIGPLEEQSIDARPQIGTEESFQMSPEDAATMNEEVLHSDFGPMYEESFPFEGSVHGMVGIPDYEMRFDTIAHDADMYSDYPEQSNEPISFDHSFPQNEPFAGGIQFFDRFDQSNVQDSMGLPLIQPVPLHEIDPNLGMIMEEPNSGLLREKMKEDSYFVDKKETDLPNNDVHLQQTSENNEQALTAEDLLKLINEVKQQGSILEEIINNYEEVPAKEPARVSEPIDENNEQIYTGKIPIPHQYFDENDYSQQIYSPFQRFPQLFPSTSPQNIRATPFNNIQIGSFPQSPNHGISPYRAALPGITPGSNTLLLNLPHKPLFSGNLRDQIPTYDNMQPEAGANEKFVPFSPINVGDKPTHSQAMPSFEQGPLADKMYYVNYPYGSNNQSPLSQIRDHSHFNYRRPYDYSYNRNPYRNAFPGNRNNFLYRRLPYSHLNIFNTRSQFVNRRPHFFNRYANY